ncbi:protein tyrosine phosphatase family protein [Nostoc sphaeroides]|uniref:beta-lactamase hydrolase domain-containing protein n=1 Tax=Nostoc sphaeroides TaxID=446679 RepID=UPI002B4003BA|nr:sulfur transferase domain-containing protein [Nostoc sphaeroides]
MSDEQQQAEATGLQYSNIPLKPTEPNQELTKAALEEIADLPKPILIHCAAGARASGIALIANAIQESLSYEQITQKAADLGISLESATPEAIFAGEIYRKVGRKKLVRKFEENL